MIVERSAYSVNLTDSSETGARKRKKGIRQPKKTAEQKRQVKDYAIAHGLDRGGIDCLDDAPKGENPVLNLETEDEGLLVFIQSTICRRIIWARIFGVSVESLGTSEACIPYKLPPY